MRKHLIIGLLSLMGIALFYNAGAMSLPQYHAASTNTNINTLRADALLTMSAKQFSELSGKRMSLHNRLSFKMMKMNIKHQLKKKPDLTFQQYRDGERRVRWWQIAGLIVVVLALVARLLAAKE